jgi:hypothetical protein
LSDRRAPVRLKPDTTSSRARLFLYDGRVISVLLALALAQPSRCAPDATALITAASARAAAFDLAGAAQRLQAAVRAGCADAEVPSAYVRGLIAAREAYRLGGSPESLAPVSEAIMLLKTASRATNDLPMIAAFVLQAAAAAAQSERDELSLMIEQAVQLEAARLSAALPGVPLVTAHDVAGDLWLQVYRYDDARRAYERAANRVGRTPRVTLGLARVAARLDAASTACTQYRRLVASWNDQGGDPPEISEARAFLSGPACSGQAQPR